MDYYCHTRQSANEQGWPQRRRNGADEGSGAATQFPEQLLPAQQEMPSEKCSWEHSIFMTRSACAPAESTWQTQHEIKLTKIRCCALFFETFQNPQPHEFIHRHGARPQQSRFRAKSGWQNLQFLHVYGE